MALPKVHKLMAMMRWEFPRDLVGPGRMTLQSDNLDSESHMSNSKGSGEMDSDPAHDPNPVAQPILPELDPLVETMHFGSVQIQIDVDNISSPERLMEIRRCL